MKLEIFEGTDSSARINIVGMTSLDSGGFHALSVSLVLCTGLLLSRSVVSAVCHDSCPMVLAELGLGGDVGEEPCRTLSTWLSCCVAPPARCCFATLTGVLVDPPETLPAAVSVSSFGVTLLEVFSPVSRYCRISRSFGGSAAFVGGIVGSDPADPGVEPIASTEY